MGVAALRPLAELYNALLTATVIGTVARRGEAAAADLVFRLFRRQHLEKFLPGLEKLGLAREPHAVACALYHYHSNALGGVRTEYLRESDRKAWVRYPPPRWMWRGTAIAAVPHSVSAAMLRGWHGHNGVTLGNPRLGFVCTGMTVDGMPGLEGYYLEHDRELAEAERVRFAYGEETMPRADPSAMPKLDAAAWPPQRLARVHRAYASAYIRTLLQVLDEMPDGTQARAELARAARLVGLQFHEAAATELGMPSNLSAGTRESALAFARWLAAMLQADGEAAETGEEGGEVTVSVARWRLAEGAALRDPLAAFQAWGALWPGACAAHDRFLALSVKCAPRDGSVAARWRVQRR